MKKQRILAMALAATTAFSMFGASLSVGAALDSKGFETDQTTSGDAYLNKDHKYVKPSALNSSSLPSDLSTIIADMDKDDLSVPVVDGTNHYLFDYSPKPYNKDDDTLTVIKDALVSNDATAAAKAITRYYLNDDGSTPGALTPEDSIVPGVMTSYRETVLKKYIEVFNAARSFVTSDIINYTKQDLHNNNIVKIAAKDDTDETSVTDANIAKLVKGGAGSLVGDILAKASAATNADSVAKAKALSISFTDLENFQTSELLFLIQEWNRAIDLLVPTTNNEDDYYAAYDRAMKLSEEDYESWNWNTILSKISLAESQAETAAKSGKASDWKKALDTINGVFKVEAKTTDFATLKNTLAMLTNTGKVTDLTGAMITLANGKYYYNGGDTETTKAAYDPKDFTVRTKLTDEWVAMAGDLANKEVGAFNEAFALYKKSLTSEKKYISQSQVDSVCEDLDATIAALDPNYTTSNWAIVKLQEALDKATEIDENDYRTTTSAWKTFVAKQANAEKLINTASAKDNVLSTAADDLNKAREALKGYIKPVPTATKNDLKASVKEANTMLKDIAGKSASQIKDLTNAVQAAQDVIDSTSSTISAYEKASANLTTSIANYKVKAGWAKQADGSYKYFDLATGAYVKDGWKSIDGTWYLFKNTTMLTGWQQVNGTWYYLKASGAMATGWAKVGNTWYYLKSSGAMQTGWLNLSGTWYYLNGSGAMLTGWNWIGGKCYYFNASGAMAANTTVGTYKVNASGAWVDANGKVVTK